MARKTEVRYVNFYTPGSVAYQYDPVPQPKKKVTLPKPRRQKKNLIRLDTTVVLSVCVAFVMLVAMVIGLVQLGVAQSQANQMERYVTLLQEKNEELDETYRAGFDPEEIRSIATAMGMIPVEQAQKIYITVPAESVEEPSLWENIYVFLTGLFA